MCGIEIDLALESGSNLTCFLCGGQNRLRFCVRAENCLVLIYGSNLTCFLAWGSELTWFLCAGRKWLVFGVGIDWPSLCAGGRNWLGFCMLAENHLVLVWTSNLTCFFCVGGPIDLISLLGIELDLMSAYGSELTWFLCGGRKWLGLSVCIEIDLVYVGDRTWVNFSLAIGIDLALVWGSKKTWF